MGKYWFLNDRYKQYEKTILYHVFTPDFDSYGWRMELAKFYADKMKLEFNLEYNLMDYREAEDYDAIFKEIKVKINNKIKREFQ